MLRSLVGRGLIYAGDTPLANTITVAQTGPMQLTVRAGSFTTTGQSRIQPYDATSHDALIVAGKAERTADGARVRVWLQDEHGAIIDKAKTYALASDQAITLKSDPTRPVSYVLDLITDGVGAVVLVRRRVVGAKEYSNLPLGWQVAHTLLFEFVLPAGCADLTPIDIYALTVMPGFPPGTGPDDWRMQTGSG